MGRGVYHPSYGAPACVARILCQNGHDLAAYSQLFTEDYMVWFLLENSLGAWWAARHPDSLLVKDFKYLRFREDVTPAAGAFPGWPERAANISLMDPCCGSGHFLVVAFEMVRRMRTEEEGLDEIEASDAVVRDNLFGLGDRPSLRSDCGFRYRTCRLEGRGIPQVTSSRHRLLRHPSLRTA